MSLYFRYNNWETTDNAVQAIMNLVNESWKQTGSASEIPKEARMKTGAINIDGYIGRAPEEQFNYLYENFSIRQELLRDYREELIQEILDQKAYNRKTSYTGLGVRIQVSFGNSNPTMSQAIEHDSVKQAIEEGILDEDFFSHTDDKEQLIRKVCNYHRVNMDFEIFVSKLGTMERKDQNILKPYLMKEKTMDEVAIELGIEYRSAIKHVYRIKKRLIEKVEPQLIILNRRGR